MKTGTRKLGTRKNSRGLSIAFCRHNHPCNPLMLSPVPPNPTQSHSKNKLAFPASPLTSVAINSPQESDRGCVAEQPQRVRMCCGWLSAQPRSGSSVQCVTFSGKSLPLRVHPCLPAAPKSDEGGSVVKTSEIKITKRTHLSFFRFACEYSEFLISSCPCGKKRTHFGCLSGVTPRPEFDFRL